MFLLTSPEFLMVSAFVSLTYGWVEVWRSCRNKRPPVKHAEMTTSCSICSSPWHETEDHLRLLTPAAGSCLRCGRIGRRIMISENGNPKRIYDEACLYDHCEPLGFEPARVVIRFTGNHERSEP